MTDTESSLIFFLCNLLFCFHYSFAVRSLIEEEIKNGIPSDRIVLGTCMFFACMLPWSFSMAQLLKYYFYITCPLFGTFKEDKKVIC